MLVDAASNHEGTAVRYKDGENWSEVSFAQLGTIVRETARGLMGIGIEPGERVAIFSDTRPEWTYADLGAICAGAVVAPVYHTSSAEEAKYVLEHSGAKLVFVENDELLGTLAEVRDDLPGLEHVVTFEGGGEDTISLDELRERGREEVERGDLDERIEAIEPDDLFTIIYTSGTTGPPKGCMLTHANYRRSLDLVEDQVDLGEDPVFYAFLPFAHVLTRILQMLAVDSGATIGYWQRDKDKLLEDLSEIRPTHFGAVPRIFEKIYNQAQRQAGGGIKGKAFDKAVDVGRKVQDVRQEGEKPNLGLYAAYQIADEQILEQVRDLFGGRLRLALTGAAPVAKEMLEFFYACGVLVLEGYGATETSAIVSVNTPEEFKFGTVGKPLPGTEVRIDESKGDDGMGEILVRGPHVFQGYLDMEEETGEVLDDDGWFHTEDLGYLDEDGFLAVTGREKDIIVTSSGKNITPTNMENRLGDHPYISHAVLYGDDRNYLVALITIDEDERSRLAEEAGSSDDPEEMAGHEGVHREIEKIVEDANGDFANIEQVKKFAVLDRDLSQEEGELTPTMKPKRSAVYENHQELLDSLYEEDGE